MVQMLARTSFYFCCFRGWQEGGLLCPFHFSVLVLGFLWITGPHCLLLGRTIKGLGAWKKRLKCIAFLPVFPWQILDEHAGRSLSAYQCRVKNWAFYAPSVSWQLPYVGWLCLQEIRDVSVCRFSRDISGVIQWIMQGFHSSPHQTLSPTSPTKVAELPLIGLPSGTAPFWGNPILCCEEEFALKLCPCPLLSTHLGLRECDKWKSNSPRPRKRLLSPACHSKTFAMFTVKLSGLHWAARFKAAKMLSSQMLLSSPPINFWVRTHQSWWKWVEGSLLLLTSMCDTVSETLWPSTAVLLQ